MGARGFFCHYDIGRTKVFSREGQAWPRKNYDSEYQNAQWGGQLEGVSKLKGHNVDTSALRESSRPDSRTTSATLQLKA